MRVFKHRRLWWLAIENGGSGYLYELNDEVKWFCIHKDLVENSDDREEHAVMKFKVWDKFCDEMDI